MMVKTCRGSRAVPESRVRPCRVDLAGVEVDEMLMANGWVGRCMVKQHAHRTFVQKLSISQ